MRFSERITFVKESEGGFNPETGKHEKGEPIESMKPCNLSRLGIDRTQVLFGEFDKKIVVARLQHPYNDVVDYVEIKQGNYKGKYQVKRQSDYWKGVFYLESVM